MHQLNGDLCLILQLPNLPIPVCHDLARVNKRREIRGDKGIEDGASACAWWNLGTCSERMPTLFPLYSTAQQEQRAH